MGFADKVNNFVKRLSDSIGITYNMNAAETAIYNVVEKIISDDDSQFFIPEKGMFYIINTPKHYFVKLFSGRIYIINSNDSVIKDCSIGFSELLNKMIVNHVHEKIDSLNDHIFNNEVTLLNHVNKKFGTVEKQYR